MPHLHPASYDLPFASGSDTSREAAVRAQKFVGKQGIEVLGWFLERGERGGTQRECAEALHLGRPSVCARVRALEQQGNLRKTPARRSGCVVYQAR